MKGYNLKKAEPKTEVEFFIFKNERNAPKFEFYNLAGNKMNLKRKINNGWIVNCSRTGANSGELKDLKEYIFVTIANIKTPEETGSADRENIYTTLIDLKDLPDDWDGCGALPLQKQAFYNAASLVKKLSKCLAESVHVYPHPQGTVSFEWINRSKGQLQVEIGNEQMSYFVKYKDKQPEFFSKIEFDESNLTALLTKLEELYG